ncbi:MAG: phage integrase N-terminal SAM-like domain-containing protein, partial [Bacteroidota bacterium]
MTAQGISCTKKKIVTLSFTRHRRKEVVSLVFDRDEQLIECVKTLPGVAWSRSRKFWYIEPGKFWLDKVFEAFRGRAWLDYSSLRRAKGEDDALSHDRRTPLPEMPAGSAAHLRNFDSWLRHKRYSASTIKTYTGALQSFLRWLGDKPPEAVGADDVVAYVNM